MRIVWGGAVRKAKGVPIPHLRVGLTQLELKGPPAVALSASFVVTLLGCVNLGPNSMDVYTLPALGLFALCLLVLEAHLYRVRGGLDPVVMLLLGSSMVVIALLGATPQYIGGFNLNGIIHRSAVSASLMIALGLPATCCSLYHFYGGTARADDIARYPLVMLPVLLCLGAYCLLMYELLRAGLPKLEWGVVTQPFMNAFVPGARDASGMTTGAGSFVKQAGFANHIKGTGLLILLTALISLPIGVGTGLYVSEFAGKRAARLVRFCTTALRGISVYILGLTAVSLINIAKATPLSLYFTGYHLDLSGIVKPDKGSFIPAAIVMALLVIPVISRATEEGCRSVPGGLRDGSLALGASEGYTLMRIVIPWALPNIGTGLLLACAETAGSLAPLLFIAGAGDYGVALFSETTTLSYAVFGATHHFSKPFRDLMLPYQFTGGVLLLMIALGLSVAAALMKWITAKRYRGT